MYLKPVHKPHPAAKAFCYHCNAVVLLASCYADIDASPGTYYCAGCVTTYFLGKETVEFKHEAD